VGAFDSAMAEIKQGLHAEETVIVSGNYGLEQDTKVMATIVPY
jgi:hypothetical protein